MNKLSYSEKLDVMTGRINQEKAPINIFRNDILSFRVFYGTHSKRRSFTLNYHVDKVKDKLAVHTLLNMGKSLINFNIAKISGSQTKFEIINIIKNKDVLEEINLLGIRRKFESATNKRTFRMELKLNNPKFNNNFIFMGLLWIL